MVDSSGVTDDDVACLARQAGLALGADRLANLAQRYRGLTPGIDACSADVAARRDLAPITGLRHEHVVRIEQ